MVRALLREPGTLPMLGTALCWALTLVVDKLAIGHASIGAHGVVLNAGIDADPEILVADVVARVREQIGPVAAFKQACVVTQLPKTRSGKILRGTMRKIANSEAYRTPPTIDNPSSLDEIRGALEALGYAKPT